MSLFQALLGGPKVEILLELNEGKNKKEEEKEEWGRRGKRSKLGEKEGRETVMVPHGGETEEQLVFGGGEKISGTITISSDSPVAVGNISLELIGCVAIAFEKTTNFTTTQKNIENESFILQKTPKKFDFVFENAPKPHESYKGSHACVRYYLKATIGSKKDFTKELNFWVRNAQIPPNEPGGIKLDIGVQGHLHIEFICEKKWYHTKDAIVGKIFFGLVRLKILGMQLLIIKEETSLQEEDKESLVKQTTIFEHEIMDGAPVKGEVIPVRIFLERYKLTPTYTSVAKKFDVKYYLKLVLIDDTKRHFFKKCEIFIWRKNL